MKSAASSPTSISTRAETGPAFTRSARRSSKRQTRRRSSRRRRATPICRSTSLCCSRAKTPHSLRPLPQTSRRPRTRRAPKMQNRPLRAEISIDRLLHNYRILRSAAGDAGLIAVVKANAYGHGVAACATALAAAGAGWLGVTCVQEGVALRAACPQARILLMSGIWQHEADAAIEHGLTPVVWEPVHLDWLEAAAQKQRGHSIPVHLEIDTGMSRQGVQLAGLPALLGKFRVTSSLAIEGV